MRTATGLYDSKNDLPCAGSLGRRVVPLPQVHNVPSST